MDNNNNEITHLPALPAGRGKEITRNPPPVDRLPHGSVCAAWMKCGTRIQEDQSLHGLSNVWMFIRE